MLRCTCRLKEGSTALKGQQATMGTKGAQQQDQAGAGSSRQHGRLQRTAGDPDLGLASFQQRPVAGGSMLHASGHSASVLRTSQP